MRGTVLLYKIFSHTRQVWGLGETLIYTGSGRILAHLCAVSTSQEHLKTVSPEGFAVARKAGKGSFQWGSLRHFK